MSVDSKFFQHDFRVFFQMFLFHVHSLLTKKGGPTTGPRRQIQESPPFTHATSRYVMRVMRLKSPSVAVAFSFIQKSMSVISWRAARFSILSVVLLITPIANMREASSCVSMIDFFSFSAFILRPFLSCLLHFTHLLLIDDWQKIFRTFAKSQAAKRVRRVKLATYSKTSKSQLEPGRPGKAHERSYIEMISRSEKVDLRRDLKLPALLCANEVARNMRRALDQTYTLYSAVQHIRSVLIVQFKSEGRFNSRKPTIKRHVRTIFKRLNTRSDLIQKCTFDAQRFRHTTSAA